MPERQELATGRECVPRLLFQLTQAGRADRIGIRSVVICPAGNSQMVARIGTRSCRMSRNFPSAVIGATTTAPLRCTTVHGNGSGRVGDVTIALWTSTYGFANCISLETTFQPRHSE